MQFRRIVCVAVASSEAWILRIFRASEAEEINVVCAAATQDLNQPTLLDGRCDKRSK
jgi:hypothetical protein